MPEQPVFRPCGRVAIVVLLTAALMAPALVSPSAAEAATRAEKRTARLINQAREDRGRAPLKLSNALSKIARAHSRTMRGSGGIFHSTDLARRLAPYRWRIAGENVGMGPSIKSLHVAFMNSKGHRRNVLRKAYRKVGVGVARAGPIVYVTVVFLG